MLLLLYCLSWHPTLEPYFCELAKAKDFHVGEFEVREEFCFDAYREGWEYELLTVISFQRRGREEKEKVRGREEASMNSFSTPPPPGPTKDYSNNGVYEIGSTVQLMWEMDFVNATLRLWQDNRPGDEQGGEHVILLCEFFS